MTCNEIIENNKSIGFLCDFGAVEETLNLSDGRTVVMEFSPWGGPIFHTREINDEELLSEWDKESEIEEWWKDKFICEAFDKWDKGRDKNAK